jgi:hypothetical protein
MNLLMYTALSRMLQGIYVGEDTTITPDMARGIVSALGQEKDSLPPHRHIAGRDGNIDECHACGRDIRAGVHTRGQ